MGFNSSILELPWASRSWAFAKYVWRSSKFWLRIFFTGIRVSSINGGSYILLFPVKVVEGVECCLAMLVTVVSDGMIFWRSCLLLTAICGSGWFSELLMTWARWVCVIFCFYIGIFILLYKIINEFEVLRHEIIEYKLNQLDIIYQNSQTRRILYYVFKLITILNCFSKWLYRIIILEHIIFIKTL